jgi:SSS family solute:Na+ symporter
MPAGLTGLLLASIFAAGMSTISTSYNSAATIILTDYFQKFTADEMKESKKMKVLYISTGTISILGLMVGIGMINAKSALDTWWKMASVFSGGVLGLFLLSAFTNIRNRLSAIIAVTAGLLIIILLTINALSSDPISTFHPYLTIVFGTSVIFIVGILVGSVLERHH